MLLVLVSLLYIIFAALRIVSDYWLSWWAGGSISGYTHSDYAHVYVYFVVALIVILILRVWTISTGSRRAGQLLNTKFMNGLLARPLSYFDTTPVGVILNRATKDMSETDINLPNMVQHTFFNTLFIVSVIVIVSIANPVILAFLSVLMVWYFISAKETSKATVDMKKVMQICTSPLISVLAESVRGSISLRAYQIEKYQEYKYNLCSELSASSTFHYGFSQVYFFMKIDFIMGLLAITVTVIGVIISKVTGFNYDGSIESASRLSLSLTWVTAVCDWVGWTVEAISFVS